MKKVGFFIVLLILSFSVFGQSVPKLSFEELEPYLKKDNDTTYIINFWATWCGPCVKELPEFEAISHKAKSNKDLKTKVILVSMDFPDQYDSALLPFIEKHGLISEVLFLDDGKAHKWIPKVDESWSGGIPASLIYKGKNRKFIEGTVTKEILLETINNLGTNPTNK